MARFSWSGQDNADWSFTANWTPYEFPKSSNADLTTLATISRRLWLGLGAKIQTKTVLAYSASGKSLENAAGATLTDFETIEALTGSGALNIAASSPLELSGAEPGGVVTMGAAFSSLQLDAPSSFSDKMTSLTGEEPLVLKDVTAPAVKRGSNLIVSNDATFPTLELASPDIGLFSKTVTSGSDTAVAKAHFGQTLTSALTKHWEASIGSYQSQRQVSGSRTNVARAAASTYTAQTADAGNALRIFVNTQDAFDGAPLVASRTTASTVNSLATNLLAYWTFDGTPNDATGNGNTLTLAGGAGYGAGLLGQALTLDGQQGSYAIAQANNTALDLASTDSTIELWVKYNNFDHEQTLIEKYIGGSGPGWTLTSNRFGEGDLQYYSSGEVNLSASPPSSVGAWHEVALVRSSGSYNLFFDDVSVASGAGAGAFSPSVNDLLIGARNAQDGRNFSVDGSIDNVAIWNRALSATEIDTTWNSGKGINILQATSAGSYSWLGNSGDWSQSSFWSPSGVPIASDAATIAMTGAAYTVTVTSADAASTLTFSSASATLKLTSSLTLGSLGMSAGTLAVNGGGSLALSSASAIAGGSLQLAGGAVSAGGGLSSSSGASISGYGTIQASLANSGGLTATGGSLILTGALTGSGAVKVAANSTLELAKASGGAVTMGALFSKLQIDASSSFADTISGFAADEAIVLKGVQATSTVKNASNQLVISNGATVVDTLQLGPTAGLQFATIASGADTVIYAMSVVVTISGTPKVGQILTSAVTKDTDGSIVGYQWQRQVSGTWTYISGASTSTYTVQNADAGDALRLLVKAQDAFGGVIVVGSAATAAVTGALSVTQPTISGTAQVGITLIASATASPTGAQLTYQWQESTNGGASWTTIAGATAASYIVKSGDFGDLIEVVATAANAGQTASKTSAATASVIDATPTVMTPTLSGSAKVGQTLTASATGSGAQLSYRWQESSDNGAHWTMISGATSATYQIKLADYGDLIEVAATETNRNSVAVTKTSTPTTKVVDAPPSISSIVFSGSPMQGQSFAATTVAPPEDTLSYQWSESSDGGTSWATISGATASSYVPQLSDLADLLRITVTAKNLDGVTSMATSSSSPAVKGAPSVSFANGVIALESGASLTMSGPFTNTGQVSLDGTNSSGQALGTGGTSFSVTGTLINNGIISSQIQDTGVPYLSPSYANFRTLGSNVISVVSIANANGEIKLGGYKTKSSINVGGPAGFGQSGVLFGTVVLFDNASIQFVSGQISTIAAGASLFLSGGQASIGDLGGTGVNNALAGLANVAGSLELFGNETLSASGSLTLGGSLYLDRNEPELDSVGNVLTPGGSQLNVGKSLQVQATGHIEIGDGSISRSTMLSSATLTNKGTLILGGGAQAGAQALLNVTQGAAGFGAVGTLTGDVELSGHSAIEFASGSISTIAIDAKLAVDGSAAFLEDANALNANSALTLLSTLRGELDVSDGASINDNHTLVNVGELNVDADNGDLGGSRLTVAGQLSNYRDFNIGNESMTASVVVTASSFNNAGGLGMNGGSASALLNLTAGQGLGAIGTVTGYVSLNQHSAIELASGASISTIAVGAFLELDSATAYVERAGALGVNSALTSLANISGVLALENGATIASTHALADFGAIELDTLSGQGGSTLSSSGALTIDSGAVFDVGNDSLTTSDKVAAVSLSNAGDITLIGSASASATLAVSGATANNGMLEIYSDIEELAGAVTGTGSFTLQNSRLQFDSSVAASQTIYSNGGDTLALKSPTTFAGTLSGFGTSDAIDALTFAKTSTSFSFVEDASNASGVLTLTSGTNVAHITLDGLYSNASFQLAADSGTGTLMKFV